MYRLFHAWTPNVIKVSVALEEMGLPYEIAKIDMMKGEQMQPEYLAISPNNKVPALLDLDPPGGGAPFAIFESGAILLYLARRSGRFLPADPLAQSRVEQWLMWQMGGFGPMLGQAHHFLHFSGTQLAYPMQRYVKETARLYGVLDKQLAGSAYVAGDYSIADMAIWPWTLYHKLHEQSLDAVPHVQAWAARIAERPAVIRALHGLVIPDIALKDEARALLHPERLEGED